MVHLMRILQAPEKDIPNIRKWYEEMRIDLATMRQLQSATMSAALAAESAEVAAHLRRFFYRCYMMLGLLLGFLTILNSFQQTLCFDGETLVEEAATFIDETIALCENVHSHNVLGSANLPVLLVVAWAAAPDLERQHEIERVLGLFQTDFALHEWMWHAATMKRWLQTQNRRLEPFAMGLQLDGFGSGDSCCVS